jgi:hypothetical protein
MKYTVIDNFLEKEDFLNVKNQIVLSDNFPWYVTRDVTGEGDDDYYLTHLFYKQYMPNSSLYDLLKPLIEKIKPQAIIRIKANFYPTTLKLVKHNYHTDFGIVHKGCIFYLNSNDGKTIFKDGTEIDSIENRLLIFEPHIEHRSTTCTNDPVGRFNINFNYF